MPTDAPAPPDSPSETGADGAARHQLTRHFERVAQALLRMSAQILSVCPELRDEHGCHCRRHHNPRCASRLVETLAEVVRTCERHLEHEQALLTALSRYGELVEASALNKEPHQLCQYLRELANDFHTYYNAHQFLVADERLRDARVKLILAVRQVLRNGLNLLGVSAPESM